MILCNAYLNLLIRSRSMNILTVASTVWSRSRVWSAKS